MRPRCRRRCRSRRPRSPAPRRRRLLRQPGRQRHLPGLQEETRRSQVKVLRPWPAEPGAEAQIDYGRLGRWLDPVAGKPVTIWAFVMVLACSRHLLVRPVIRLDQQGWSESHVAAFAFFGRCRPGWSRNMFRGTYPASVPRAPDIAASLTGCYRVVHLVLSVFSGVSLHILAGPFLRK